MSSQPIVRPELQDTYLYKITLIFTMNKNRKYSTILGYLVPYDGVEDLNKRVRI